MIHESINLRHWTRTFPLATMRDIARDFFREHPDKLRVSGPVDLDTFDVLGHLWPVGDDIVGPYELAQMEQRRQEVFGEGVPGPAIPVDLFALAAGEPANRAATKIGGLPYWPRDLPWPQTLDGRAMTFVCQFCFVDSFDLVGDDLPGEVLLVFIDRDGFYQPRHDEETGALIPSVGLVWLDLDEERLVERHHLPDTGWRIRPLYGIRHRTWDYPEVERRRDAGQFDWTGLGVLHGLKIGGRPFWCGEPPEVAARYLASVPSVLPLDGMPYPFVNVLDSLPPRQPAGDDLLVWGRGGQLNLFLQPATADQPAETLYLWDE